MKEYFVVNNQEDEDGCVLYPANAIIDKTKKMTWKRIPVIVKQKKDHFW